MDWLVRSDQRCYGNREPLIKPGFLNIVHGLQGLTRNSGNKTLLIRENPCESVDPFDNAE